MVEEKVNELSLEKSKQKPPVMEKAFMLVLDKCNSILNETSLREILNNKIQSHHNPMTVYTSALIIKTVMLTGIKNQVIDTIKLKDYNSELNILEINGFEIRLPNQLGMQIKKYLEVRKEFVITPDENYPLFIKKNGTRIGTAYTDAFKVLKDTLDNASGESVAKYTIMQMIKKGMNINIIKTFTKFGIETCLHCQELVNDEMVDKDKNSQNRYIDSKIRSMEMFDLL